jgi:hypothetical protein
MPNSVAGRAIAELRRNGRTTEAVLADKIDTDVDTLRASLWHAEQDRQVRRMRVEGLWWCELMAPVQPAVAAPAAAMPAPASEPAKEEPKPEAAVRPAGRKLYVPRLGTIAYKAVSYLREHGETSQIALCEALRAENRSLPVCLGPAMEHGLIKREKRPNGQIWYSMAAGEPAQAGDPVDAAVQATAVAEQLEQRRVDAQEREAQDRMFEGLRIAECPPLPHEVEKRLRATIQELESALAARDERIADLNALLDQSMPAERPVEISVTLSITGTPHQAERVAAFARSMTEVR